MPFLKRTFADQMGFRLFELDLSEEAGLAGGTAAEAPGKNTPTTPVAARSLA
jgi:hypothetical protein